MPKMDGAVRDKPPCMGCQRAEKTPGCHGKCEAFNEWRRKVDEANEARRRYRDKPPIKFT